jgi:hypothetical protein
MSKKRAYISGKPQAYRISGVYAVSPSAGTVGELLAEMWQEEKRQARTRTDKRGADAVNLLHVAHLSEEVKQQIAATVRKVMLREKRRRFRIRQAAALKREQTRRKIDKILKQLRFLYTRKLFPVFPSWEDAVQVYVAEEKERRILNAPAGPTLLKDDYGNPCAFEKTSYTAGERERLERGQVRMGRVSLHFTHEGKRLKTKTTTYQKARKLVYDARKAKRNELRTAIAAYHRNMTLLEYGI